MFSKLSLVKSFKIPTLRRCFPTLRKKASEALPRPAGGSHKREGLGALTISTSLVFFDL